MLQLLGVALAVFFLIRLLPADPVARLVGLNASEQAYAQAERTLGLDRPIIDQLLSFFGLSSDKGAGGLADGSLGLSWVTSDPVFLEIGRFLPVTLELVTLALLISFLIAIPLGMASATKPGGIADRIAFVWGLFAGSQPDYWWGLLFVFLFFFTLGIAPPPLGRIDPLLIATECDNGFPHYRFAAAGALRHVRLGPPSLDAADPDPGVRGLRRNHEDGAPEHDTGAAVGLHPLCSLLRPLQAGGRALRAPCRADARRHAGRHLLRRAAERRRHRGTGLSRLAASASTRSARSSPSTIRRSRAWC